MATWSEDLFSIIQMARSSSQTGMKVCPKNPFGWELQSQKPREFLSPHFGVQAAGSWNFILTKSTRQNKLHLAAEDGGESVVMQVQCDEHFYSLNWKLRTVVFNERSSGRQFCSATFMSRYFFLAIYHHCLLHGVR